MAFEKKTWKDRIAEFPTRRRLTKNDNSSELVTVAREEGTVSQEGDAFSAENMNNLEERIDAEFTSLNGKLNEKIPFYQMSSETDFRLDYSIGFAIINDVSYIMINCGWIHTRFRTTNSGISVCYKYGSNGWQSDKGIY